MDIKELEQTRKNEEYSIILKDCNGCEADAAKAIRNCAVVYGMDDYINQFGEPVEGDGVSIIECQGEQYVIEYCL